MKKYKKKPLVVKAFQWEGGDYSILNNNLGRNWGRADAHGVDWINIDDSEKVVIWNVIEQQWLCCPVGWWIVFGLKDEVYPIESEIFEKSYEVFNVCKDNKSIHRKQ